MEQAQAQNQDTFVQWVAYFLAEILRSRRTSLRRAAEISQMVVENLSLFSSESAALSWVKEIEKDFEELADLKQILRFNNNISSIVIYEKEIKEYASRLLETDMMRSADFLKDASADLATIQQLCVKYPDFCDYLLTYSDKGELLPEFQKAS